MNDVVLDVRNLRVEFPTRKGVLTAVDDISVQIRRGEILGVVGESGAGKSMTGMSILGLLEPPGRIAAGSIHLSGDRIDNLDDRAMQTVRGRRIGAIFQDPLTSLNPLFRIGDQLVETIRLHTDLTKAQARDRAMDLMREVGIPAVEELQMIPGSMPRLDAIPDGCAFNPRCAHAGPKCFTEAPRIGGERSGAACWLQTHGEVA